MTNFITNLRPAGQAFEVLGARANGVPCDIQLKAPLCTICIVDSRVEDYDQSACKIPGHSVRVRLLATANEALRIPRDQAPLFFVINTSLPDMPGFELREMLVDRWPLTPSYLIGNANDPQDEIQARCSGATLYFCKPLQPGWLAAAFRPEVLAALACPSGIPGPSAVTGPSG